jgi:phosphoglucosamine mutase
MEHLLSTLDGRSLAGIDVVVDCAHGAGFELGPRALREAGAHVLVLHAEPDGRNINDDCGSTHPEALQAAVVAAGAQLGLALDGDGDRVLAVDERGKLVDGDQIMTMCAMDMHERAKLRNDAIAVTVMSNLGLRRALRGAGIDLFETPVGDRHVVAAMQEHDLALGGEQSGHIVFADFATTGDGLLTGLQVADLVIRSGRPLSALASEMHRVPQVLVNVRVKGRVDVAGSAALGAAVREVERELGDGGRVLVRGSGTEPLVRIMIEADEQAVADSAAGRLRAVVTAEFGAGGTP